MGPYTQSIQKNAEGDDVVAKIKELAGQIQERVAKRNQPAMSDAAAISQAFKERPDLAQEFHRRSYT